MENSHFYIGYNSHIPKTHRLFLKKIIPLLLFCVLFLGILLALSHKQISTSTFEMGHLTELEGYYFEAPVPLLKVIDGKDIFGNPVYKSMPLVNYAKFGADDIIRKIEDSRYIQLNGKKVILKGTLIYDDGKTLLELTLKENSLISFTAVSDPKEIAISKPDIEELGMQTIKGEIVDAKCYFGAMRPGFGKTHRACAIRCISGGIPPVLAATNYEGATNYFLIRGSEKSAINQEVLTYVAEPVALTGNLVRFDDWMVLYIDPKTGIMRN